EVGVADADLLRAGLGGLASNDLLAGAADAGRAVATLRVRETSDAGAAGRVTELFRATSVATGIRLRSAIRSGDRVRACVVPRGRSHGRVALWGVVVAVVASFVVITRCVIVASSDVIVTGNVVIGDYGVVV